MKENLLKETTYTDADFDKLFAPVKKALQHFGKTVAASAKLVGNDVATLMKLTMHWKLRSPRKQKEIMDGWKSDRTKYLKEVSDNSMAALEGLGAEKYTAMALFPGVFWTSKAVGVPVMANDARVMVGDLGFNKMPIVGGLFAGDMSPSSESFWGKMLGSDADPGSEDAQNWYKRKVQEHLEDLGVPSSAFKNQEQSGLSKAFNAINDIFLFSILDSVSPRDNVLFEGEEKTDKEKHIEGLKEAFMNMFPDLIEDNWPVDREGYVEEHRKIYEPVVKTVEVILSTNTAIATSEDPDEFFKILDAAVKKHEELKDMDVQSLTEEFDKMVKTLSEDEKVLTELRKDLEKSGELKGLEEMQEGEENKPVAPSEKEMPIFEKHLKKIALDNVKGAFLPSFKEGAMDLYDDVRFRVTDGLQEETIEILEKEGKGNEAGMQFIKQIREFQKRLDESLSKLK